MFAVNVRFLVVQVLSLVLLVGWPVLSILALVGLRKRTKLHATARALWALMIVSVPILGAIAYWIVRPDASDPVG
ncbi:MAG: PLDc N-terminal domain-containing protein [Chloroflexi bacterium]|nr:PLDc N-terminal domain-containing protein [Chloroflexota bacterium]